MNQTIDQKPEDMTIREILDDHRSETWSMGWNGDATEKAEQAFVALIRREKLRTAETVANIIGVPADKWDGYKYFIDNLKDERLQKVIKGGDHDEL